MPSSTTSLSCISSSSLLFPSVSSSSSSSSFFSFPSSSFSPYLGGFEGLQALPPLLQRPVGQVLGCLHTGQTSSSPRFQNNDRLGIIHKLQNCVLHDSDFQMFVILTKLEEKKSIQKLKRTKEPKTELEWTQNKPLRTNWKFWWFPSTSIHPLIYFFFFSPNLQHELIIFLGFYETQYLHLLWVYKELRQTEKQRTVVWANFTQPKKWYASKGVQIIWVSGKINILPFTSPFNDIH